MKMTVSRSPDWLKRKNAPKTCESYVWTAMLKVKHCCNIENTTTKAMEMEKVESSPLKHFCSPLFYGL